LVEAAENLGMARGRVRWVVELPLAGPVIWAGVRTSAVWTVGLATLSEPVGQPSLGTLIFGGLRTIDGGSILVGCVAAAGLAIVLDRALALAEAGRWKVAAGVLVVLVAGSGVWATVAKPQAAGAVAEGVERVDIGRAFVVGSKDFNESEVLAQLAGRWVNNAQGFEHRRGMGGKIAFDALAAGDIDAYVDYTGTIWATLMGREDLPPRGALLAQMSAWLAAERGVVVVAPLGFENAYALAVRRETAQRYGLETISALSEHAGELSLGSDPEFFERAEWAALRDTYGLGFDRLVSMQPTLMYPSVAGGEVDVITAYTTDGRIPAMDLVVLPDDRGVLPPYDAVLLLSPRAASEPAVVRRLQRLAGTIDKATMQEANRRVDIAGESVEAVAEWLVGEVAGDE